jgi:hypothetical protein
MQAIANPKLEKQVTAECPKERQSNPLRLLVGKVVYLDISSSYKLLNKVKECLNLIEVVWCTFIFKNYCVSSFF